LAANEHFDVRIWREGEGHYGVGWSESTSYEYDPASKGGGNFFWSVAVIRGENGQWQGDLSDEATPRSFTSTTGGRSSGGGAVPTR
jgi:hypothetical protein